MARERRRRGRRPARIASQCTAAPRPGRPADARTRGDRLPPLGRLRLAHDAGRQPRRRRGPRRWSAPSPPPGPGAPYREASRVPLPGWRPVTLPPRLFRPCLRLAPRPSPDAPAGPPVPVDRLRRGLPAPDPWAPTTPQGPPLSLSDSRVPCRLLLSRTLTPPSPPTARLGSLGPPSQRRGPSSRPPPKRGAERR